MANLEKHPKKAMEEFEQAESSMVPACARAPRLIGQYTKNRRNYSGARWGREGRTGEVILRMENLPATPHNREVMRERVRAMNQQLEEAGVPFRLRMI
ncbi:MAG: hypothetical protein IT167_22550 [Bryobacterales bacterium]|nr:hypothetical protein [Bryobacterales bacterium]MCC6393399.1 hypothetical protein [Bryobacterales bacterium]MCZ2147767.1 hypothetical protein [Bryobacterales bacterium]